MTAFGRSTGRVDFEHFLHRNGRPEIPLTASGAAEVPVRRGNCEGRAIDATVKFDSGLALGATGAGALVEIDRGLDLADVDRRFELDEFIFQGA
jgi:hypothetical protein